METTEGFNSRRPSQNREVMKGTAEMDFPAADVNHFPKLLKLILCSNSHGPGYSFSGDPGNPKMC